MKRKKKATVSITDKKYMILYQYYNIHIIFQHVMKEKPAMLIQFQSTSICQGTIQSRKNCVKSILNLFDAEATFDTDAKI